MDKISKITITYKDLEKLVEKGREKYMGEILPTFKNPQVVFKDMQGDVIFAREMNDKLFFVNVTCDYGDDGFLSVTQSPKKENTLFNKLANPQEVYLVEETLVSKIPQHIKLLQTFYLPPTRLVEKLYHKFIN